MIKVGFEERLQLLNLDDTVRATDRIVILTETQKLGKARLICHLNHFNICFLNADKQTFRWLRTLKCADAILFEQRENRWILKIVEFKKCMTVESVKKSLEQFEGALYNAIAIAGFLQIEDFEEVRLYSAFRFDKMNENPLLRKRRENQKAIRQWERGKVKLPFIDDTVPYKRIILDENGDGEVTL